MPLLFTAYNMFSCTTWFLTDAMCDVAQFFSQGDMLLTIQQQYKGMSATIETKITVTQNTNKILKQKQTLPINHHFGTYTHNLNLSNTSTCLLPFPETVACDVT